MGNVLSAALELTTVSFRRLSTKAPATCPYTGVSRPRKKRDTRVVSSDEWTSRLRRPRWRAYSRMISA